MAWRMASMVSAARGVRISSAAAKVKIVADR